MEGLMTKMLMPGMYPMAECTLKMPVEGQYVMAEGAQRPSEHKPGSCSSYLNLQVQ
jgi:hypothetical protein